MRIIACWISRYFKACSFLFKRHLSAWCSKMRNTSQAISCELNTVLNSANRHLWIVKKAQSDFLFSPPKTHGSWLVMPSKHQLWSMLHWAMHKTAELSVFVYGRQCMLLFVLFETIPTNKCKTLSLLLILQVRLISNWPSGQIFIITVYLCAWQKGMIMSPILSKEIFVSITFKKQNSCMVSSNPVMIS